MNKLSIETKLLIILFKLAQLVNDNSGKTPLCVLVSRTRADRGHVVTDTASMLSTFS